MSKRKPMDKTQARERRNRLLESAAAAELSLTEGVREMRAIAGMTQEEFARHRGVSARVIKAIELEQGNPTVATLNRIGQFFGLEVAFVPIRRMPTKDQLVSEGGAVEPHDTPSKPVLTQLEHFQALTETQEKLMTDMQKLAAWIEKMGVQTNLLESHDKKTNEEADSPPTREPRQRNTPTRKRNKPKN